MSFFRDTQLHSLRLEICLLGIVMGLMYIWSSVVSIMSFQGIIVEKMSVEVTIVDKSIGGISEDMSVGGIVDDKSVEDNIVEKSV